MKATTDTEKAEQIAHDLEPGDRVAFPNGGPRLTVEGVTPASEAPEGDDAGPLYESHVDRSSNQELPKRLLYRPHNIKSALVNGADVIEPVADVDDADPFWCAGCEYPHLDENRHTTHLDVPVCSYGCEQDVERRRRQEKREGER